MRRSKKNNIKKERIIMLASSAFVLAAMTMTGVYMKNSNSNAEMKDDGYTLDFTAMEDSADKKLQEIAQNESSNTNMQYQAGTELGNAGMQNQVGTDLENTGMENQAGTGLGNTDVENQVGTNLDNAGVQEEVTEDDLDYMPMEVGSGMVEIPGLTDNLTEENIETDLLQEEAVTEEEADAGEEASAQDVVVQQAPDFSESDGLLRPVSGEVLMSYSMDKSIYFATLDQYKYNPAVIFAATEGTEVTACADAKVISIFENEEIGNAVTLDLGNGYQATYGQLGEIAVEEGAYVDAGDKLGIVASPTKYYSVEGSNLFFELTKDEVPVNPEKMF